jgi:xanthine dehydrogenase YagT iron-sulfur-binding subunit
MEVKMPQTGVTRRKLLGGTAVAGAVGVALGTIAPAHAQAPAGIPKPEARRTDGFTEVALLVNGHTLKLQLEPRTTLLDALREYAGLTGTKKGCDRGACGACTVHLDGRRVNACLTLAARCEGRAITTVEGLAQDNELHPMQAAFVKHDAFQCGYCTSGQLMSAVALVDEGHAGDATTIREWMSGNICRCGAYPNIVDAIQDAAPAMTSQAG